MKRKDDISIKDIIEYSDENMIIHDDKIQECIYDFCNEHGIADLKTEPQNIFTSCLLYIKSRCFPDGSLKQGNGYYDIDKVSLLLDYYINLCLYMDKVINIVGFSSFSGINTYTIDTWGNSSSKHYDGISNKILSEKHSNVYQKLKSYSEESVQSMLISGKRNPVGAMAILNHNFGWSMPGVKDKEQQPMQISKRDELEKLAANTEELPELPTIDDQ